MEFRSMSSPLLTLRDLLPLLTPLLNASQPHFRFHVHELLTNVLTVHKLAGALKQYKLLLEQYVAVELDRLDKLGALDEMESLRTELAGGMERLNKFVLEFTSSTTTRSSGEGSRVGRGGGSGEGSNRLEALTRAGGQSQQPPQPPLTSLRGATHAPPLPLGLLEHIPATTRNSPSLDSTTTADTKTEGEQEAIFVVIEVASKFRRCEEQLNKKISVVLNQARQVAVLVGGGGMGVGGQGFGGQGGF